MHGKFICIEGGAGSGKTTMAKAVVAWLESKGRKVKEVFDPGSTPLAMKLREILVTAAIPCTPRQQTLLYIAARTALADEILRLTADGYDVVCGRWTLSTLVMQGRAGNVGTKTVEWLADRFVMLIPDLYIVLDADPVQALARKRAAVGDDAIKADRFDGRGPEWHEMIRNEYRDLATQYEYPIVNADLPVEQVAANVIALCTDQLEIA